MVAIVRLEGYEKLAYMRHFSEKATGRRTGGNGIFVPPWVLKVTQRLYFGTQGKPKVVY